MLWRITFIFCLTTVLFSSLASCSVFFAGFVEDEERHRIPGATIVLHQAGIKLDDLKSSESGWFESRDLSLEVEIGSEIRIAVIKEGFELLQRTATVKETENFLLATLERLEGILALYPEDARSFTVHGYLEDKRGNGPVAGARIALRIGHAQVGLAYSRESGYFSLPVTAEYLGHEGELAIDHIAYEPETLKAMLSANDPLRRIQLRPAVGYLHFVSYPEVLALPFEQLDSENVILGRNLGYSRVFAEMGDDTSVDAVIELNSWQMRLNSLNMQEARALAFNFDTSFRNLPRETRRRVLKRLDESLPRLLEPDYSVQDLRMVIEEFLRREVDGFLGKIDKAMIGELQRRQVSAELRKALHALDVEIVDKAEIKILERGKAWWMPSGYLVLSVGGDLLVYRDLGKEHLPYTQLIDSPENAKQLENLVQGLRKQDNMESNFLDLGITQAFTRRPPEPVRERWSLGLLVSYFSPLEKIPEADLGSASVANLSFFPFVRLRNPLERAQTRLTDFRSNFSIDAGVGWGSIGRRVESEPGPSRPIVAGDEPTEGSETKAIYKSDFCLSVGLGYRIGDALLSGGFARINNFNGYYLGFGISVPIRLKNFKKRDGENLVKSTGGQDGPSE